MENIISSLLNIKEQMEHSLQRFDALQQHLKDLRTSHNKMHQIFRQSIDEFEESFYQLEDRICEIEEEDVVAVEEKEAITLDPIIISQVSINAVGDPKPIPSSDCPLVLLSISTISMFPDSDHNQEISKGFLITLNLACLASAIRKDLVRKSAIAEEMCFMEGGLNEWPRLTWQPPWETYRAEKLTFSLFGVHQPKSTPLFPNRNQNRLHPPKPSAESLLETPILSYFFFEFCSNLLQEGHLCQQIHISKFLNRNQANKSLIPPSFRSRSNFFDPSSAELSLYLLSFGGSIAQQKAHNRGAAKGVTDALVFTAVRPQLLVEATKASNAIQLFKAALQSLKDLLELQPSVFKRRGEWAFLITGSEEWIYDWVVANCAFGILLGYSLQTTRIIELEAWALDEKDPFMQPEGGETTMSGFSFGGMDLWGYTSKGGAVRLARGTVAWELFDERHEGTLADEARVLCATLIASNLIDESKNPIQRMDCNRVEALTGPKNAHDIPAANAYVQIRSLTWPGVLTSTGDTVDCRNNINQSPVTSISYKRRCSQTSKEEHETLSYEELQSLDDFELANVVIFGMVEVYKVLSTLLVICGGKIFISLQALGDTKIAHQLLDVLPLRVVFKPFDRGKERSPLEMNYEGRDTNELLPPEEFEHLDVPVCEESTSPMNKTLYISKNDFGAWMRIGFSSQKIA